MAVVESREMYRGRGRQAQFGDVPVYTRIFLVKTDTADTTLQDISAAPGIEWLASHPENSFAYLIDSNVQQDGDSPFHYRVTFTYKSGEDLYTVPWERPAQFSFSGTLASVPAFWYYPNNNDNDTKQIIVNSAGDPIGGLERDEGEFTVTISKNLRVDGVQPYFSYVDAQLYVGAINSDTWSGGAPRTWKCMSISANRKIEQVGADKYVYWEVNTTLGYRSTGWDLRTWDVGFNEIVWVEGAYVRKKILAGADPVSEPAALISTGTQKGRAKPPGEPPDEKVFRIYRSLPFTGRFPTLP